MRSEIRMPKPSGDEWNRWFAWYPVMASVGDEGISLGLVPEAPYVWVWWEYLERKKYRYSGNSVWINRMPLGHKVEAMS